MVLGRVIGWLLLVLAIIAAGSDLWGLYDTGRYAPAQLGELWLRVDGGNGGLVATRALLATNLTAWIWDPVLTTILQWPAALTFTVLAFLMIWSSRPRERRRRR